jgi:hypothetical protein
MPYTHSKLTWITTHRNFATTVLPTVLNALEDMVNLTAIPFGNAVVVNGTIDCRKCFLTFCMYMRTCICVYSKYLAAIPFGNAVVVNGTIHCRKCFVNFMYVCAHLRMYVYIRKHQTVTSFRIDTVVSGTIDRRECFVNAHSPK